MLKKILLYGCLPATALLVVATGALYFLLTWAPAATVRPQAPTPEQQQRAEEKIEATVRSVKEGGSERQPGPADFRLELSAADLNALFFASPEAQQSLGDAGFRRPSLEIRDQRVAIHAFTRAMGRELYLTLEGQPAVTPEGGLALEVNSIRIGHLPVPARLRDQITEAAQKPLREWSTRLDAHLHRAALEGSSLVLEGVVRRR